LAFAGPLGVAFAYEEAESGERLKPANLIGVVIAACIVSCLAAYLITLGFSEPLYKDLSYWNRYRNLWEQEIFWFCIMISIPVVAQLSIFFYKLKAIE
jgi:H+/Cl- antiporter ClcA